MKKISLAILLSLSIFSAMAQTSSSFELRYFSDNPKANGETDFIGETEIFNTGQRVEFLKQYADFAGLFFKDADLDYMVVSEREASMTAARIKPQPQPEYRRRILLDQWKWRGYRPGLVTDQRDELKEYEEHELVAIRDGALISNSERTRFTWKFPMQSWRSSFSWRVRVPSADTKTAFIFSEREKITGAEVGFGSNGRFYYTTADNETVEHESYEPDRWYLFKIEFDFAASRRGRDLPRYNFYIDGEKVADFVPIQRIVSHEDVGWPSQSASMAGINRMTLGSGADVGMDDIWGVGYHPTGRENFPYSVETFLDQDFESLPPNRDWHNFNYDDALWNSGILPISHGGERHAEEDLFLRKKISIGEFGKAYLNIETLDPGGEVWVNGSVVAVVSDRTPQCIDLTRYLKRNEENIIAVKVNHFYLDRNVGEIMHHSSLDFNVGWFTGKMSLDLLPLTSIQDAFVYTSSIEGGRAAMVAKVNIENKFWKAFRGTMEIKMHPWYPTESRKAATEETVDLLLHHDENEIELTFDVDNARLWSPDDPNLYALQFILKDEKGRIIDDYMTTTGIRTVDQKGGSFRLNGEVSMLNGAQIMGYRAPLEDMISEARCPSDEWVARELLQVKKMNGNLLRVHVHHWEFPARGVNDPRYAAFADQMGIMLIWCPTAWIRTGRGWGDIDFANFPDYMKQVMNHPSIVMWEAANHTQSFYADHPVSESNVFCEQVHNTIYPVDPSRIISYNSHVAHLPYGNDEGSVDREGNEIDPGWAWTAPMVTRGNQDSPTGYGKKWSAIRNLPGDYRKSFLDSKFRAYFNFEHEESIGQPNWNLVKGKPWYLLHSYEWGYDEGSIGRRLTLNEWRESQAWQGFSAWEAMKKMRFLDYDGFSWCCLHGGANSVTYKKPLIDFMGHAKIAWHVNKMVFQKTVAGTGNVDVVIGPGDKINPVVINWNSEKSVSLKVKVLDAEYKEVAVKEYEDVQLEGGRTVKYLEGFKPEGLKEGYYFLVFEIDPDESND